MIRIGSVEDVGEASAESSPDMPVDGSWPMLPRQRGSVEGGSPAS